jgi:hypothetical protein
MPDVIQQAIENKDDAKYHSIIGGIIVTALLFFFPVGLMYMFIFHKSELAFLDGVYLFMAIYAIGATTTLMYYRFIVVGDDKIEIDKMSLGVVSAVFGKCFAAFFGILGFTMVAVALNPSLVRIFENTVGFAVCRMWGVNDLLHKMLKSELFDKVSSGLSGNDKEAYMNYDFLLTTWTDKAELETMIRAACQDKKAGVGVARKRDLRFDFYWNAETITNENITELMKFIDLKYSVGHFTWVYIGSLFSLLVSIVAAIMSSS